MQIVKLHWTIAMRLQQQQHASCFVLLRIPTSLPVG